MKNLNCKSKFEQLFLLLLICMGVMGILGLTGCGKQQACETVKCGYENKEDMVGFGISVPGCGGICSSGKGCIVWPQSCKVIGGCLDDENTEGNLIGCETRYYSGGCLGCGQVEESCYNGVANFEDDNNKMTGCFYGSTKSDEKSIGCYNGCGGCIGSDFLMKNGMDALEYYVGID